MSYKYDKCEHSGNPLLGYCDPSRYIECRDGALMPKGKNSIANLSEKEVNIEVKYEDLKKYDN